MTTKVPFDMLADAAKAVVSDVANGVAGKLVTADMLMDAIYSRILYFTAGDTDAELVSSLPLNGPEVSVNSVGPISLTPRDLILATGEMQGTTDESEFNTLFFTRLILATSPSSVVVAQELSEANGLNITPELHHYAHQKSTIHRSNVTGSYYLNHIARAASSSGSLDLVIDTDYSRLYALVLKDFFPA